MTRSADLDKYIKFYKGNRDTIYTDFKSRRVSTDIAAADKFPLRDFVYENDIKVIQRKRINFYPQMFDAATDKESTTTTVTDWLAGRNFNGKTFWEALSGYYETFEDYGDLFVKLYVEDGVPRVQKLYSEDVTIEFDPKDVTRAIRYTFEWEQQIGIEGGGEQNVQMKEVVDDKEYVTYCEGDAVKKITHNFGFIPILHAPREREDGKAYGISGIADLIEPQQNINMVLTKRAWATKHNSFKVWCAKEAGKIAEGEIKISPGALTGVPIESVGGDIDLSSLEREYDDYRAHIFDLGSVPDPKKTEINTNISAVAIDKMNEPLKEYVENKLPVLRKFFEELIEKAFETIGKTIDVTVTYPSLDTPDMESTLAKARFMGEQGYPEEALRIMGYEDDKIEALEKEREEKEEKVAEFQKKMFNRGPINEDEDTDEGENVK